MDIQDKVVLITGACGGIGSSLLEEFIARKAKKIYAAGINVEKLQQIQEKYPAIVQPIKLDVTNLDDVLLCHEQCSDTDILVNNAGVECATRFLGEKSLKAAQFEMSVNYFGVHNLCHAFWDSLQQKQSAAIVNVLSIASFTLILKLGTYCASKVAGHFLTQALRRESESIKIFGVYPGYVDTTMTKNIDVEKVTPQEIAKEICSGIENDILDIFPDKMSEELVTHLSYKTPVFTEFNK